MSSPSSVEAVVPLETIASAILVLRGQKVILDADLARLYGTTTGRLNEQVRRNPDKFPADFMFQLTAEELQALRSHFAISKGRGGRRYLPYAFTEHGALMAATVLSTPRAVAQADGDRPRDVIPDLIGNPGLRRVEHVVDFWIPAYAGMT